MRGMDDEGIIHPRAITEVSLYAISNRRLLTLLTIKGDRFREGQRNPRRACLPPHCAPTKIPP
jgi:hypothetical protein